MNSANGALYAYLATLSAIVLLAMAAALVCIFGRFDSEVSIARVIGALGFVQAAISGLIGVIGTFRPKGPPLAATESGDVTVTGPAE